MRVTYCLVIRLKENKKIKIGSLGLLDFRKGYYLYVGSAPSYKGYYTPRIERHFKIANNKNKVMHWHIDYFLEKAEILDFVFSKHSECNTAKILSEKMKIIEKFGCSDCRCKSHLFYFGMRLKNLGLLIKSWQK